MLFSVRQLRLFFRPIPSRKNQDKLVKLKVSGLLTAFGCVIINRVCKSAFQLST